MSNVPWDWEFFMPTLNKDKGCWLITGYMPWPICGKIGFNSMPSSMLSLVGIFRLSPVSLLKAAP
jgi:hypothetical protein